MAIDSFMTFVPYKGDPLKSESTVDFSQNKEDMAAPFTKTPGTVFEVDDYSFDIEQVLNIGSQSTGAGAGKVSFNPFSITRKIDRASPTLFQMACSGTPFQQVYLGLRKSSGGDTSGVFFLRFDFKLVAVKTVSWSHGDESPNETVTFEYGGLQIRYSRQKGDGTFEAINPAGWDRTKNISDVTDKVIA